MEIIDQRLIGGVLLAQQRRISFDDATGDTDAWQVSSIASLMDGNYDGDLTLAELMAHGDLGLGTVQHLDGELIVLDGEPWQVRADGSVHAVDPFTRTPFAVVCHFHPGPAVTLSGPLPLDALTALLDDHTDPNEPVVALRIDGTFTDLTLRSVAAQTPPYPPLSAVVEHQTTWRIEELTGTVVGFRFPADLTGVEVPGYHLHVISDDRTRGGHVVDLTVADGVAHLDGAHTLHLELPAGADVVHPDRASDEAIRTVEGH